MAKDKYFEFVSMCITALHAKTRVIGQYAIFMCAGLTFANFSDAAEAKFTFKSHGKIVKTLTSSQMAKIAGIETLNVFDPTEKAHITFKAYPIKPILESVYGNAWTKSEIAVFASLDGYQPITTSEQLKRFEGYLAFKRMNSTDFSLKYHGEGRRKINLVPFYWIWKMAQDSPAEAREELIWPYQIIEMNLTSMTEHFPRIAPPETSSPLVTQGFTAFRTHCLKCHTLNGEGGRMGPELNYPVNVTEYFSETLLPRWISAPQSIRFNSAMPALPEALTNREQVIHSIVAYLKAMKDRKVKPAE